MSRYFRAAMIMCSNCKEWIPKRRRPCHRCGVIPLIPKPSTPKRLARPTGKKHEKRKPSKLEIAVPMLTNRDNAFVYMITDGKFCKIGFAKDLRVRLSTLQNATPHDLRIVDAIETDQHRALESFLHGLFASKHHRNEWFKRITVEEWREAVKTAEDIITDTISSGFPQMAQNNTQAK